MQEYYYLTKLKDSPYNLTEADALHLGSIGILDIYVFIDHPVYMAPRGGQINGATDRDIYLRLQHTTCASLEKACNKISSVAGVIDFILDDLFSTESAMVTEKYNGSIPIGTPFTPELEENFYVSLHTQSKTVPGLTFTLTDLLIWADDLEQLVSRGTLQHDIENTTTIDQPFHEHQDYPPHLEALILAWRKFWKNADDSDRSACPNKDTVKDWLMTQGLSDKTADAGATIIKPKWAKDKGW